MRLLVFLILLLYACKEKRENVTDEWCCTIIYSDDEACKREDSIRTAIGREKGLTVKQTLDSLAADLDKIIALRDKSRDSAEYKKYERLRLKKIARGQALMGMKVQQLTDSSSKK